ncbi:MAG: DNA-binding protein HU-beta [Thermodesulfobacteriota bacterium]|nr:DNA-binding protein HU-beta [Thermodesulfobacteriota bacterium]MDQ1334182.1 DNA-binding protein HU-beta [Thermodesulfobacteriota bacterium]
MKKEELIAFVSEQAGITKKSAGEAVNAVIEGITSALEKGDSISFPGFGSFKVVERPAREGRNPSTGEKIQIAASKAVKFTAGATLKDRVNK